MAAFLAFKVISILARIFIVGGGVMFLLALADYVWNLLKRDPQRDAAGSRPAVECATLSAVCLLNVATGVGLLKVVNDANDPMLPLLACGIVLLLGAIMAVFVYISQASKGAT